MNGLINEEKLGIAIDTGLDKLIDVLKTDEPKKEQLTLARLASSVLNTGARYQATQNAQLSLRVRVAQMVLKDNKERRKYLIASSPELKLLA